MQTSKLDDVVTYLTSSPSCRVAAVCESIAMWKVVVLDVCDKMPEARLERLDIRCGDGGLISPITNVRQTEGQRFHAMWVVGYPPGWLVESVRTRLVHQELS